MAALEALREEPLDGAEIVWLSDGVAVSPAAHCGKQLRAGAEQLGPLQVFAEAEDRRAPLLCRPRSTANA